jgi:hypothetical protein
LPKYYYYYYYFVDKNGQKKKQQKHAMRKKIKIYGPSMCGKIKPVLRGRGLEIPRQESSMLYLSSPKKKYLQKFLKTTRENMGIE